tara:strand:- start:49 stop:819 length:771 start_codon:yes stop_codon:yes gene_type:complete
MIFNNNGKGKIMEDFISNCTTMLFGDCLERLKEVPENSVDLVVTSPPYNMNLRIRNGKYCSRQIVKEITTKYKNFDDNLPMEKYLDFNVLIIGELLRVCSGPIFYNVQFLTGNKPALFKLIGYFSEEIKEFIIWDKVNAQPAIGEKVLNSQFEVLLVFDKYNAISRKFDSGQFNRGTLSNVWQIKRGKKNNKTHGAVFPIELAEKIISNFSNENSTVLDPFTGTGTSGVAAKKLSRKFIGIEMDNDYFEFAVKSMA